MIEALFILVLAVAVQVLLLPFLIVVVLGMFGIVVAFWKVFAVVFLIRLIIQLFK